MWYDRTVKVERETASARSASGQKITDRVEVIASLPCSIQAKAELYYIGEAGNTVVRDKVLKCAVVDLQTGDVLTDLVSLEVYEVFEVIPHTLLPHLEVKLKGGVL